MISNAIGPIAIANVAPKTSALKKITYGDCLRIAKLLARDGDADGAQQSGDSYHNSVTPHLGKQVTHLH
jgi:hypothetical protein